MTEMGHNFCYFIHIDDEEYECIYCGIRIVSVDGYPPIFPCLNMRIIKDKTLCTYDQIEKRFTVCQNCEFFKNNTCSKCDCIITRNLNYSNKLFYKDQECPESKWPKEV